MLNKIWTDREIFGSKVDIWWKRCTLSLKFSLWRQVPEMWRVARGFMVWFFVSWGIGYRIKNVKTNSGRMTSLTFFHPISHCATGALFWWSHFTIQFFPSLNDWLDQFKHLSWDDCMIFLYLGIHKMIQFFTNDF
jgi:hypothetical protein